MALLRSGVRPPVGLPRLVSRTTFCGIRDFSRSSPGLVGVPVSYGWSLDVSCGSLECTYWISSRHSSDVGLLAALPILPCLLCYKRVRETASEGLVLIPPSFNDILRFVRAAGICVGSRL